ncbi:hypothetical protein HELRODRAFT_186240 [Helobdella robusta]|uniref:Carbonic anhydrase n=1 Tax=Helobdella robusta TaxID=6412 RepID=T1FNV0_HELRO|nr:hypothetical protein HELRODRAFT_186240 [Helobdella robusta]ESN89919.1 hypothetical protein HELRODRAFT_186240 [Helobdella robusta]
MALNVYRLSILIFVIHIPLVSSSGDWSYTGENGPNHWGSLCRSGSQQSPINIDIGKSKHDQELGQFIFSPDYFNYTFKYNLSNNGHSVMLTPDSSAQLTVSGGGLPGTYRLAQFHFHWGGPSSAGSEHTLNNKQYQAEVHLVHYNLNYDNIGSAATSKDGLAVIGVFLEAGKSVGNVVIEKIANRLSNSCATVLSSNCTIDNMRLIDILPFNHDNYFRYQGSLTTPPCSESVVWTVFQKPISVTKEQLQSFFRIQDSHSHELHNNFRPVQKYKKPVTKSFSSEGSRHVLTISVLAFSSLVALYSAKLF